MTILLPQATVTLKWQHIHVCPLHPENLSSKLHSPCDLYSYKFTWHTQHTQPLTFFFFFSIRKICLLRGLSILSFFVLSLFSTPHSLFIATSLFSNVRKHKGISAQTYFNIHTHIYFDEVKYWASIFMMPYDKNIPSCTSLIYLKG